MIIGAVVVVSSVTIVAALLTDRSEQTAQRPAPTAALAPAAPSMAYLSYPINLDPNGDNWLALRSLPNGAGVRLDKLGPDTQFEVVERQGDWSRVRLPDGRSGWVASHYVGCCRGGAG